MITVDGGSLTIDAVVRAARGHEAVALDPGVRARMLPAREVVDRLDRDGAVVYGGTTGLGALAGRLSGARVELVEALLGLLDAGIIPWVPEHGSLGASGDLAPLASIATVLLGLGWAAGAGGVR